MFKIRKLKIENFKAVRHFEYDGWQQVNMFVGMNGAGKSTLLQAIDVLFSWFVARLRNAKGAGYKLTDEDITHGCHYVRLEIELENGTAWSLYKQKTSVRTTPPEKSKLEGLMAWVNDIVTINEGIAPELRSLPVYVCYGVNRTVTQVPMRIHKAHAMGVNEVYADNHQQTMNFMTFFKWFREREDLENEMLRDLGQPVEDTQLKAVREAIRRMLPGFDDMRVDRRHAGFTIAKEGERMRIESLSDGEKAYILLVADVARRLAMANPGLKDALEAEGVVLIDEVELHLHPEWQRDMLPLLKKTFRRCQFVVTSHAPLVLGNVNTKDGYSLHVMRGGEAVYEQANLYGRSAEYILSASTMSVTNTYASEVKKHVDAAKECLRRGEWDTPEFEASISWLKQHVDPNDEKITWINMQANINKLKRKP